MIELLEALANLHICQKQENNCEEGDLSYYFNLEDALLIENEVLNDITEYFNGYAEISVITHDKGDPNGTDQLCIYFIKNPK